jgi:hypothetical protein
MECEAVVSGNEDCNEGDEPLDQILGFHGSRLSAYTMEHYHILSRNVNWLPNFAIRLHFPLTQSCISIYFNRLRCRGW